MFHHTGAKVFNLHLHAARFILFLITFDEVCVECAVKVHCRKQANRQVSSAFPVLLESLIVSSFFLTSYQKHDCAPCSICLLVICNRNIDRGCLSPILC